MPVRRTLLRRAVLTAQAVSCVAVAQRAALHRLRLLFGGLRVRGVLAPSLP